MIKKKKKKKSSLYILYVVVCVGDASTYAPVLLLEPYCHCTKLVFVFKHLLHVFFTQATQQTLIKIVFARSQQDELFHMHNLLHEFLPPPLWSSSFFFFFLGIFWWFLIHLIGIEDLSHIEYFSSNSNFSQISTLSLRRDVKI